MHNIPLDYASADMYARHAGLREAQRNGTAYLKPERKAATRRHRFTLHLGKFAVPRYISVIGLR